MKPVVLTGGTQFCCQDGGDWSAVISSHMTHIQKSGTPPATHTHTCLLVYCLIRGGWSGKISRFKTAKAAVAHPVDTHTHTRLSGETPQDRSVSNKASMTEQHQLQAQKAVHQCTPANSVLFHQRTVTVGSAGHGTRMIHIGHPATG